MLTTFAFLAVVSLALALLFTPIVRSLACRLNLVDMPDNKRKVHKKPIPRVGGVAVGLAFFGSLLLVAGFWGGKAVALGGGLAAIKSIVPAALLIFFVGLADDIFNLKPWHKFAVQFLAAGMVVSNGIRLHSIPALNIHPVLGIAISVFWLVGCTNAVNLIDGLDGLAAGVSLLATLTALIASLITGNTALTLATAPLAGALLGFLVFNFNPASIFMGDSGSLLLGFLLGCDGILWSGSATTIIELAAPLMAIAVPLTDTTVAITRRFLSGQPLFKADRSHIHHRLLARGFNHRDGVLLLYVAAAVAGFLSLSLICAGERFEGIVFATFVCTVILCVRQLDYAEFDLLRKLPILSGSPTEVVIPWPVTRTQKQMKPAMAAADMKVSAFSGRPMETQQRPAA